MSRALPRLACFAFFAFGAFGTLAGCPAPRAEDPQSILRSYSHALEEGRAEDAYRMLSEEARRGISLEAFRRMLKDNPEEVREIAKALARPTATPVVTATVTSGNGQELQLVLENGKWRVEATAIDLYAQDTPRHAIQGFVRAVERKRYDVVLKFVPDSHKEGLDPSKLKTAWEGHDKEEIEQVVSSLKQALPTASIEETGGSRDDGVWRRHHAIGARAGSVEDRRLRLTLIALRPCPV